MHIQCTHTKKPFLRWPENTKRAWTTSDFHPTSTAKVAVIMPQEVVKLFHSQQAQLKVLYVHLDDSHISPRLKCWVEDSLILTHHLQLKYRYNSAQTNEAEGTTWSRLFISLNPQSKVKHPNQVLTHLVKGIEQIHITCDVCFVGFHFWREPFRKAVQLPTPSPYPMNVAWIHSWCLSLLCNAETPKSSLN